MCVLLFLFHCFLRCFLWIKSSGREQDVENCASALLESKGVASRRKRAREKEGENGRSEIENGYLAREIFLVF